MTTAYVQRRVGFDSGLANAKLRRDIVIGQATGGVPALFDFKALHTRDGHSGVLAGGVDLLNLVDGGDPAEALSGFTPGLTASGLRFNGSGERLQLPSSFKVPANRTSFGISIWASLDASQPQAIGAASSGVPIAGCMDNQTTGNQWGLILSASTTTGVPASLQWYMEGQAYGYSSVASVNGLPHQFAARITISGGNKLITRYLDGAIVGGPTSTATDGSINQPTAAPMVGYQPGYPSTGFAGTLHRIGIWNGDADDRSFDAFIAEEWSRYAGRF